MNSVYLNDLSNVDWIGRVTRLAKNLAAPMIEIFHGIRARTIPWPLCLSVTLFFQIVLLSGLDKVLFKGFGLKEVYPKTLVGFVFYYALTAGLPFWIWGLIQVVIKKRLTRRLTEAFQSCGLKNNLGKLPHFIFDKPLDSSTRKLRLTRAILPLEAFQKAKDSLNGGLQIFIDEIRENRVNGTVDIIYSHLPMPEIFKISNIGSIGKSRFIVGTTRSKTIESDLDECPHLLVAGQTGKGKSTFLRQLIASLYLNDTKAHFTLIDLKGGLEFQLFERLPRIKVPQDTNNALYDIKDLTGIIDKRMKLLKANHCKDLAAYLSKNPSERIDGDGVSKDIALYRHIVVVDEAAEMFLAGHHASAQEIQAAKKILSKIARQGRSLGVHLVVATQRPDSKALDPQVKANLAGVLCFQMANDASSITVLGNGRATDLPATPGRAIWKVGSGMQEVQTPLLETGEVETLLKDHYQEVPPETVSKPIDEESQVDSRGLQSKLGI